MQYKTYNAGFTLLELLIVIALVSSIAFFGWLVLYKANSQQELKNTTLSITALLRDAQQRSITQSEGRYWGVCFVNSHSGDDYYFLFNSPSSLVDCSSAQAINLLTLKPSLNFQQPSEVDGFLAIVFEQISGKLISSRCPDSSIIEIGIAASGQSELISVFCNGRIEF